MRAKAPSHRASEEQVLSMIRLYEDGYGCTEIGERLGFSGQSVWRWMKKRGVQIRPPSESNRKHTLNAAAFNDRSPAARYWAGFLMADGCVTGNKSTALSVGLGAQDAHHLEKLKAFLGSTHPVSMRPNRGYGEAGLIAALVIVSQELAESLKAWGIVPRKTWAAEVPDFLSEDVDFFRGLVDGDGWICLSCGKGHRDGYPVVGLTGTRAVCEAYSRWATTVTDHPHSIVANGSVFKVVTSGVRAQSLVRMMYSDPCVSLDRKQERARQVIEWVSRRPPFTYHHSGSQKPRVCGVEGCDHTVHAKGLCRLHYRRQHKSTPHQPSFF